MSKAYLIERSSEDSYDRRYRDETIYDGEEIVYSTREVAQARCDELNMREYERAKSNWERQAKPLKRNFEEEMRKYEVLTAAGIKHPKPREAVGKSFATYEEWSTQRFFDADRYSVLEWELQ